MGEVEGGDLEVGVALSSIPMGGALDVVGCGVERPGCEAREGVASYRIPERHQSLCLCLGTPRYWGMQGLYGWHSCWYDKKKRDEHEDERWTIVVAGHFGTL